MKSILAVILCILIIIALSLNYAFGDELLEDEPFEGVFSDIECSIRIPEIDASSAIVIDMETGRVLYEKNAYKRRAMASTTKIMTAIVALENGDVEDIVTVSKRAANIWGSKIHIKAGQKLKLRELLYGLMLNSGNDAAIAIAEHIGGSVEGFLDMMNKKAIELGAKNTCFKTPHGLDADGHYTTAYELAMITRYALKNPEFSKIVGTKYASISIRDLRNTNEMLGTYPGADGVKTGYTGQAGRCLVTSATRDGWRIISVVLNCPTRYKRALSSKLILDYVFNNYKNVTLIKKGEVIKNLPVIRGIEERVPVEAMESIRLPMREDEINALETAIFLPESLEAPVYGNIEVGKIKLVLDGKVIAQTSLKTCFDVRRKNTFDYLGDIFTTWFRMMREGIFMES
ncbi:MAG: D-alanyl-D-alanine carboxypeptidase family protein [Acetivibrionales bacterium]|jgi:D-alanyl-D-alanine carboxypeptidase (penicillin-binding protein 5/6)